MYKILYIIIKIKGKKKLLGISSSILQPKYEKEKKKKKWNSM